MFICLRNDFLEPSCSETVTFVAYSKSVSKHNFGYIFLDAVHRKKQTISINVCYFVLISETCHCLGRLTTSWRRYAPYVNFTEDGKPGQIIPLVLQSMVKECCGDCRDPNQTVLDFGTNGRNEPSNKNSSRKLLEGMDELTDFTFPVYGHIDQDSYKGGFGYTPVIESAGVAFIVHPEVSKTQNTLFQSILNCLPVLILPIVTAYIAGVIIWCLVSRSLFVHLFSSASKPLRRIRVANGKNFVSRVLTSFRKLLWTVLNILYKKCRKQILKFI